MPELPEVQTTLDGIRPHWQGRSIQYVHIRQSKLRWPVPDLEKLIKGQRPSEFSRRSKYMIVDFATGHLLIHLGMSGSLRFVTDGSEPRKHDHIIIGLEDGEIRYHDPRRFGAWIWTADDWMSHHLITGLGPEPLSQEFDGDFLYKKSRGRKINIKSFIMNAKIVVGVGNIYANEALFASAINPTREAGSISRARYARLVMHIKAILNEAICQGGTTLKDFVNADNSPGYFAQQLKVYGRQGEPCVTCHRPLNQIMIGQRRTVFCTSCQR